MVGSEPQPGSWQWSAHVMRLYHRMLVRHGSPVHWRVAVQLGEHHYVGELSKARLEVRREAPPQPTAWPNALTGLLEQPGLLDDAKTVYLEGEWEPLLRTLLDAPEALDALVLRCLPTPIPVEDEAEETLALLAEHGLLHEDDPTRASERGQLVFAAYERMLERTPARS